MPPTPALTPLPTLQVTRKDSLSRNINRMRELHPSSKAQWAFMPESFVIPEEYDLLAKASEQKQQSARGERERARASGRCNQRVPASERWPLVA